MATPAPLKKPGGNIAAKTAPKVATQTVKPAGKGPAKPKADPKKVGERLAVWMA